VMPWMILVLPKAFSMLRNERDAMGTALCIF